EGLNSAGEVISERNMDPSTLDTINFEKKKREITLDRLITSRDLDAKKLADYDVDRSLERRLTEAEIGARSRQYTGEDKKPPAFSAPSRDSVKAAFGKEDDEGNVVIDAVEHARFQKWRAKHPEIRSGEEALSTYLYEKDAVTTTNIQGHDVTVPMGWEAPTT